MDVGCTGTCVPAYQLGGSVGSSVDVGCTGTCVPAYQLGGSVGSSAWRDLFTHYVSTIFPSDRLAAQVLGVPIGWFEVLEVLEGECLDRCV